MRMELIFIKMANSKYVQKGQNKNAQCNFNRIVGLYRGKDLKIDYRILELNSSKNDLTTL